MKILNFPPRNLFGLLNQETPSGPKKLAIFRRACTLMQVPLSGDNYDGNGMAKNKTFHVHIFDPCSSWSWYVTDWDGADFCFGFVEGFEKEWSFFSLEELSNFEGAIKLGLEVDVNFSPVPYSAILNTKAGK